MAVMNRSMFQRPMPVVRRQDGTPMGGERQEGITIANNEGINTPSLFDRIKNSKVVQGINDFLDKPTDQYGEGSDYVLDEYEFNLLYPNVDINSTTIEERTINTEGDDYKRLVEITTRAEGSPPQGEIAGEQVNTENVGIMDGFSGEGGEAEAMAMLEEGERAKNEIDDTNTYDELMRSIRGDDLSEADRRQELASYVGEKDAEETPDSVLTLVQPVMQMLDQDTASTGIGQIEEGQEMATIAPTQQDANEMMAMNMPQQPVGVANGGYMSSFPNQNLNTESLSASDNIDDRIMQNLQFERMAPGMMGYANGGQVQHFAPGGIAAKKAIYDPLYMELMEGFNDPERNKANTLMDISKLALAYGRGDIDPSQAGSMFLDSTQKRLNTLSDKEKALEMQLKSGSLSSSIAAQAAEDLAASNLRTAMAKKSGESGITYFKEEGAEVPLEFADISGLVEKINGLPNGSTVFVDKNNKSTITLPKVENKEAYYDTREGQKKVVFFSDEEINAIGDTSFLTTVGAGLTFVKIKRVNENDEEEILDINLSELQKYLNENKGWEVVPDSQISIKKDEGIVLNSASGGPVRKREAGSPEEGEVIEEESIEYYDNILKNAEEAMKAGKIFVAQTESDRSFFNSLYTSAYDGLNELQTLKKLIAEDPNLVGYTGVFKQTLNKVAGFVNDMENAMGDKIFPDDGSTAFGQGMQFLTAPEIALVKSSVEQLSDAVADIMSLRGKRGTPESVRRRAEKRTDVVSMDQREVIFNKIDKLTDFMIDKTKLFGLVSGNYDKETYPAFSEGMETLRLNLKAINPKNFSEKKTTYTIEELQNILGE